MSPDLPPALRQEVESFKYAPWKATTKQMRRALQKWRFEKVRLALAEVSVMGSINVSSDCGRQDLNLHGSYPTRT